MKLQNPLKSLTWNALLRRSSRRIRRRPADLCTPIAAHVERLEDRTLLTVSVIQSYAGLNSASPSAGNPPDSQAAAGPSNLVEAVNQVLSIHTPKSSAAAAATASFSNFFGTQGGLSPADGNATFQDPGVTYDEIAGRFIVVDESVDPAAGKSVLDIAVSKSSNPTTLTTADWNFFQINTGESGPLWANYPGNIGYNADALVVTFNMFNTSGVFQHSQVDSISMSALTSGTALTVGTNAFLQDITSSTLPAGYNDASLRPTVMHDSLTGDPMWLIAQYGDNSHVEVIKMANVLSNSSTFTGYNLSVTAYNNAVAPKNPDGSNVVNASGAGAIDSRILKAAESNDSIVATQTVSPGANQDAAAWYQIDVSGATPTLTQQGRVAGGANTYIYYPGIDINSSGQIGMSYMRSGTDTATDYVSMRVTGRKPTDATGTMEAGVLVPAGAGQANLNSGGFAGNISGINVDPTNGTFWAANEFANTNAGHNWGTAIANFSLTPPLITPPIVTLTTTATGVIQLNSDTVTGKSLGVLVKRINANTVEFTVTGGQLLYNNDGNEYTTLDVALPSVKSITVNLGGGFDTFKVDGVSTTGDVTFTGLGGGADFSDGWNLEVTNDTASNMTVGGSILARLGTATGAKTSDFEVDTSGSSALHVVGNVSVTDATNLAQLWNEIAALASGNLTVSGNVQMTSAGSAPQQNFLDTNGGANPTGKLTVTGNVTINSSGSGNQFDELFTGNAAGSGSLAVGGNVAINDLGTGTQTNELFTGTTEANATLTVLGSVTIDSVDPNNEIFTGAGNLTTGAVSITSSSSSAQNNWIYTNGAGLLTTGNVSISSSGSGAQKDLIDTNGSGNLTVNGSVSIGSSGSGNQTDELFTGNAAGSGSLHVTGNVAITDNGTGAQFNELFTGTSEANATLTVGGSVTIHSVDPKNLIFTGAADLTAGAVSITSSASTEQDNWIYTNGAGNLSLGNVAISSSGSGLQKNLVYTRNDAGKLTITGYLSSGSAGSGNQTNEVFTSGGGNLTVTANVSLTGSGTGTQQNLVESGNGGGAVALNTVSGNVTFTDSGAGDHSSVIDTVATNGNVSVKGGVSFVDSGNGTHRHIITAQGGNILIGTSVAVTDSGSGRHLTEISTALGAYTVTVNGNVAVTDAGTGTDQFLIGASVAAVFSGHPIFDQGGGNVIIGGNVTYDNHTNTTGFDSVLIGGDSGEGAQTRIGGSLALNLANDATRGNVLVLGYEEWYIQKFITAASPETATGKSLVVYGPVTVTSGAGADQVFIQGAWIKGLLCLNTGTNPLTGTGDSVDIEGSEFDGGGEYSKNQITMSGNHAVLYVADSHGSGWDPTLFEWGVQANMPGPYANQPAIGDRIFLGGSNDGLTFNQNLCVIGTGPDINGTLFVDGAVTFLQDNQPTQPVLVYWQEG